MKEKSQKLVLKVSRKEMGIFNGVFNAQCRLESFTYFNLHVMSRIYELGHRDAYYLQDCLEFANYSFRCLGDVAVFEVNKLVLFLVKGRKKPKRIMLNGVNIHLEYTGFAVWNFTNVSILFDGIIKLHIVKKAWSTIPVNFSLHDIFHSNSSKLLKLNYLV